MLKHTFQLLKSLYSDHYLFIALAFFLFICKALMHLQVTIFITNFFFYLFIWVLNNDLSLKSNVFIFYKW